MSAKDSEEMQDVVAIFSNIEEIVQVHQQIYAGMIELQTTSWPLIDGLGRLFLHHARGFQNYEFYAENFEVALATIDRLHKKQRKQTVRIFSLPNKSTAKLICVPEYRRIENNFAEAVVTY